MSDVSGNGPTSSSRESDQQFHMSETAASIGDMVSENKPKVPVDRFALNDMLTAYTFEIGARLEDDDLNELTHQVADFIEQKAGEFT